MKMYQYIWEDRYLLMMGLCGKEGELILEGTPSKYNIVDK